MNNNESILYPKSSISITTIDVKNGTPLYIKNLSNRIARLNKSINYNKDFFNIVVIKGLYGYRCGAIGRLFNNLAWYTSTCFTHSYLKPEDISLGLSLVTRFIPILNLVSWDPKLYIRNDNLLQCLNYSMPDPTFNSIFRFKPLYDSGLLLLSNEDQYQSGFEVWNNLNINSLKNDGMQWVIYRLQSGQEMLVINTDILDIEHESIVSKSNQIISLRDKLNKDTILIAHLSFTTTMSAWGLLLGFEVVNKQGDLYILRSSNTIDLTEDLVLSRCSDTEDGDTITEYQRIDLPKCNDDTVIDISPDYIPSPTTSIESWEKI